MKTESYNNCYYNSLFTFFIVFFFIATPILCSQAATVPKQQQLSSSSLYKLSQTMKYTMQPFEKIKHIQLDLAMLLGSKQFAEFEYLQERIPQDFQSNSKDSQLKIQNSVYSLNSFSIRIDNLIGQPRLASILVKIDGLIKEKSIKVEKPFPMSSTNLIDLEGLKSYLIELPEQQLKKILNITLRFQNLNLKLSCEFRVTLFNYQIAQQIELNKEISQQLSIFIPYDHNKVQKEQEKLSQANIEAKFSYIYFKPKTDITKVKIYRDKGHPKLFLYNCQINKLQSCREQIQKGHVQGGIMLKNVETISIQRENRCKDKCLIILGFKQSSRSQIQLYLQIGEPATEYLRKQKPFFDKLTSKQSKTYKSTFQFLFNPLSASDFICLSINSGNIDDLTAQITSVTPIFYEESSSPGGSNTLVSSDFQIVKQSKAIHISFYDSILQTKQQYYAHAYKFYEVEIKVTYLNSSPDRHHSRSSHSDSNTEFISYSIADVSAARPYLQLKDGNVHSLFPHLTNPIHSSFLPQYRFKVFLSDPSFVSVIIFKTKCQQFHNTQIRLLADSKEEKQQFSMKLIHNVIAKFQLPGLNRQSNQTCSYQVQLKPQDFGQQSCYVYIETSITQQFQFLFVHHDIIQLTKGFSYHSQLHYKQESHFLIQGIKKTALIKIQKCSDCHILISYSTAPIIQQEQISESSPLIHRRQLKQLKNQIWFQLEKDQTTLYINVQTNNFAHYVITVSDESMQKKGIPANDKLVDDFQDQRNVLFSLEEDTRLELQFEKPSFQHIFLRNDHENLNPIEFYLIQGSIKGQVMRQTYCPRFSFSDDSKTKDISRSKIIPSLIQNHDIQKGLSYMKYNLTLKHHDYFGIRAHCKGQIYSYKVVNIESMKEFGQFRWIAYNLGLFVTLVLFISFVCLMAFKKKKIRKRGGEILTQDEDNQESSLQHFHQGKG